MMGEEKQTVNWRDFLRPLMTCQKDLDLIHRQLVEEIDQLLQTMGDDASMQALELQQVLQKHTTIMDMMSHILKVMHDATMAAIRNMK